MHQVVRETELTSPQPTRDGHVIFFDGEWQYPAVTELTAWRNVRDLGTPAFQGARAVYLAFPWATLIDLLDRNQSHKAAELMRALDRCSSLVSPGEYVITVCQHIRLRRHLRLFERSRVNQIFWSHAEDSDKACSPGNIKIVPFPLFPVQKPIEEKEFSSRQYLCSFVGARATDLYRSQARNWIHEILETERDCAIATQATWFFNEVVYSQQILGQNVDIDGKEKQARHYSAVMSDTRFALCPSGTGPNTIRLWEALAHDCVPVILADGWWTPGTEALWEQGCVIVPETIESVTALPQLLRQLESDDSIMESKRAALAQLKLMYCSESLVPDLLNRAVELGRYENKVAAVTDSWGTPDCAISRLALLSIHLAKHQSFHHRHAVSTLRLLYERAVSRETNTALAPSQVVALCEEQFWEIGQLSASLDVSAIKV